MHKKAHYMLTAELKSDDVLNNEKILQWTRCLGIERDERMLGVDPNGIGPLVDRVDGMRVRASWDLSIMIDFLETS